jgi:hypothetical protein
MEKSPAPSTAKPKLFYGYVIVAVAFLLVVIMSGSVYTFGVFLKPPEPILSAS